MIASHLRAEPVPMSVLRCDDRTVRAYISAEMLNFNPYRIHLTARELHGAAKRRFGLARCLTLEWWIH